MSSFFPPIVLGPPGRGNPLTATSFFKEKTVNLTRAQFAALFATPATIIPAPAATSVILPVYAYFCKTQTVASGGPSPTFRFRWAGDTTDVLQVGPTSLNTVPINPTQFLGQSNSLLSTYGPAGSIAAAKGKALTVGLTADPLGVFQATFTLTVVYCVLGTASS